MTNKPQRYAVVGMKFRGKEAVEIVETVPNNEPVTLVREPRNKYDPNAVQVWCRGTHVGYISKDQNAILSKFIDSEGQPFVEGQFLDSDSDVHLAMDAGAQPQKGVKARFHKGNNTYPLVEIA